MGKKKKCAGLPRVPHAMRVVDVGKGKRSIAETFFFHCSFEASRRSQSGPSSNAILRGAGQLSWRLAATTHPAVIASPRRA